MRDTNCRRLRIVGVVLAAALAAVAAGAEEPGVVIALDSSRSLSPAESRSAATLARDLAVRLAATAPTAVLTFDDEVRWLARAGEPGAEAALDALTPSGRFTVMHDGLVEGVRSLAGGGVLVLLSDGKDENSATTLEDVARLASERGVRVVALGAGRVDERAMRRLALLTGGLYAGSAAVADRDALAAEVESLRRQVAAEAAPPPAPAPVEVVAPPPVVEVAPPPAPRDGARLLLILGALLATLGVIVGFLLARRRPAARAAAGEELDAGTKPGVVVAESAPPPATAPDAVESVDEISMARLQGRPQVPPGGLSEAPPADAAAMQGLPFSEAIERTLVLTEEVVLTVREAGRPARDYRLPLGRAVDIGRDAQRNTLAFHDATMSSRHLRLALEDGAVLVADLGSTNGVLVQERRVASARLLPGDRFRAGMVEFEIGLRRAGNL